MQRQSQPRRQDDGLEVGPSGRPFDHSATSWLVGHGVRSLHAADKEGEHTYGRVIELLGSRDDAVETVTQLAAGVPVSDVPLRWSLLHVLGDIGAPAAATFLTRVAVEHLPQEDARGCESVRDGEILVRTMAVEALKRIATRHTQTAEHLLKIVSERPVRPILIEAVKAANELGLRDKVRELLPEQDRWILDIRPVRVEEVHPEPERSDVKERGFTPPKMAVDSTTPRGPCSCSGACSCQAHGEGS